MQLLIKLCFIEAGILFFLPVAVTTWGRCIQEGSSRKEGKGAGCHTPQANKTKHKMFSRALHLHNCNKLQAKKEREREQKGQREREKGG